MPTAADGPPVTRIALIGDYTPAAIAHQAIPQALARAAAAEGVSCEWAWVHTSRVPADAALPLAVFDAVWCVPASPYANTAGALSAIRFARESGRPFLGTCGGFQHALLEYAAAVWGVDHPAHAETEPSAVDPVIAPLVCSLVEQRGEIRFVAGSRLAAIYGELTAVEGYHCRYGLSPRYAARLDEGPLRVSGRNLAGDVRAVELDGHPFLLRDVVPAGAIGAGRARPPAGVRVRACGCRPACRTDHTPVGPVLSPWPARYSERWLVGPVLSGWPARRLLQTGCPSACRRANSLAGRGASIPSGDRSPRRARAGTHGRRARGCA